MKFELLKDTHKSVNNHNVYRIKALKSFGDVTEGDLGGWIEAESNLSQKNDCWVYDDSTVYGGIEIFGNATIHGSMIHGNNSSYIGDNTEITNSSVNIDGHITKSILTDTTVNGRVNIDSCFVIKTRIYNGFLFNCDIKGDITINSPSISNYRIEGNSICIYGADTNIHCDNSVYKKESVISGKDITISGGDISATSIKGHNITIFDGTIESSAIHDDSTIYNGSILNTRVINSSIYNGKFESSNIEDSYIDATYVKNISCIKQNIVGVGCLYSDQFTTIDNYRNFGPVVINNGVGVNITMFKANSIILIAFGCENKHTGEYVPCVYKFEEFIKGCPPHVIEILNVLKKDLER